jgi:4-hydroxy-4-methyl-2-oxoglutarate aldolase
MSAVQQASHIDDPPKETTTRVRLRAGELGLDIYRIRGKLKHKGLVYRPYESEA